MAVEGNIKFLSRPTHIILDGNSEICRKENKLEVGMKEAIVLVGDRSDPVVSYGR